MQTAVTFDLNKSEYGDEINTNKNYNNNNISNA